MKLVFTLTLILSGNLAFAEGYKDYSAVFGNAQRTFARLEEDRNEIIKTLKIDTDENASAQCAQAGFFQASRKSEYKISETLHGGFAYLSTIRMSAEYDCTSKYEIICRKVGTTYIVKCCDGSGSCWIE